jgi:hypothetical protein
MDATSVYGYAGPVACDCAEDAAFLDRAWAAMTGYLHDQGVVSIFTRFHPVLGNDRIIARTQGKSGVTYHGHTVAIDLRVPEETTWRSYDRKLRHDIRRAMQSGMESIFDPDWKYFDDFLMLYYATMERNHASSFYFFSRSYIAGLKRALGPNGSLVVLRHDGRTVAVCLMIDYNGLACTYLSASDLGIGRRISAAKVLNHETQLYARRRNNRVLHLGGGRGNNDGDSLFSFKAEYSPERYAFSTGRWILRHDAYDELTRLQRECAARSGKELAPGFFPAYRAPFVEVRHAAVAGQDR